jgi:hypothetical protein
MKSRYLFLPGALALSVGFFAYHFGTQAAPPLLPFQGRLTDAQGNAVADGARVVQFKIYDAPVGGSAVWNGEVQRLTVNAGLVSTLLGTKANLSNVDFDRELYLELTVDANNDSQITAADPPLLPRQSILPAIFSKEAADSRLLAGHDWSPLFGANDPTGTLLPVRIADGSVPSAKLVPASITAAQVAPNAITAAQIADNTITSAQIAPGAITRERLEPSLTIDSIIPPGTISAFGGPNPPIGWLLCDGSALDKDNPAYTNLWSAIGTSWGNGSESGTGATFPFVPGVTEFNVPDLRGMFLRGVSGVSTNDPDRMARVAIMSGGNADNQIGSIQPDALRSHTHDYMDRTVGGSGGPIARDGAGAIPDTQRVTSPTGGNETRPRNAYVNYIIKY